MTWSRRTLGMLAVIPAAVIGSLLAFHSASHADPGHPQAPAEMTAPAQHGPVWQPTAVNAPGLPQQCADGAWTRTVVRGGCARHGGVAY